MSIHWSLVPGYDYESARQGLTYEGIQRELEMDWDATEGKRVYPEFGRARHVSLEPLVADPEGTFYLGWDMPGHPACVISQLNGYGQYLILASLSPPESAVVSVYDFGQQVAEFLTRRYATPANKKLSELKMVHVGDPAGWGRPPRTGDRPKEAQACFEIIQNGLKLNMGTDPDGDEIVERRPGLGWRIQPGAVNITERLEAIKGRLRHSLADGLPALVVCQTATDIISGFMGGYHYAQRADGRYALDPNKNWSSNIMDAMAYPATRLFVTAPTTEEKDEDEPRRRYAFRSHAASPYEV